MSGAKTSKNLSPKLLKVAERAKREPETRLLALAHLMDEELLKEAFDRIRKDAAVGVDGVTKEQYGERVDDNIRALQTRVSISTIFTRAGWVAPRPRSNRQTMESHGTHG